MKSIVLPVGTRHVRYNEVAHLIADALWPEMGPDDERWGYGAARVNLDSQLRDAVRSGSLPVKDPLTLGPHTFPTGNALLTALVAVDDLQTFVAGRGLSVVEEVATGGGGELSTVNKGTPAKLTDMQKQEVLRRYNRGRGESVYAIAKSLAVSRNVIDRALIRAGIKNAPKKSGARGGSGALGSRMK